MKNEIIARGRGRRRRGFVTSWQLGVGVLLVVVVTLAGFAGPTPDDESAPVSMAARFTCTATRVHDGDGPIWCEERDAAGKTIKIRLHAVAAREMDETCSPGHPCPDASGAEAQRTLQDLALGQTLRCEPTGTSYSRVTAWCWRDDGVELNCAMVKSGTALRWPRYDRERRLCT